MSLADFEIRNVRVYGEGEQLAIGICGREISYVGHPQDVPRWVDGRGLAALPGLIDGHVHFRHFGEAHKEDWAHASRAALAGGVTAVLDIGNHPGVDAVTTAESFARKVAAIGSQALDWRLWFMATPGQGGIWEFEKIFNDPKLARHLAGIKLCMETTTGGLVVEHRHHQLAWCNVAADTKTLVAAHVGVEALIRENRARFVRPTTADHCVIREAKGEIDGGTVFLELLEQTGARGEIKHVSLPELIETAKEARQRGVQVSLEMCPHHWLFTDVQLRREDGAFFKMNPPLRTVDQVRLMPGYLADGTVNTIATDHAPHTKEEKQRSEYDVMPSGIPGVQEMLPVAMRLVQQGVLTLAQLIDLTSRTPARLYGLTRKGSLAPDYDADVVLVDPAEESIFSADEVASKCDWSSYAGMTVYGKPKFVMACGQVVLNRL